jgi:hypothetical protein
MRPEPLDFGFGFSLSFDFASAFPAFSGGGGGALYSGELSGAFCVIPARIAASSSPSTSSHAIEHSTVAPPLHASFAAA